MGTCGCLPSRWRPWSAPAWGKSPRDRTVRGHDREVGQACDQLGQRGGWARPVPAARGTSLCKAHPRWPVTSGPPALPPAAPHAPPSADQPLLLGRPVTIGATRPASTDLHQPRTNRSSRPAGRVTRLLCAVKVDRWREGERVRSEPAPGGHGEQPDRAGGKPERRGDAQGGGEPAAQQGCRAGRRECRRSPGRRSRRRAARAARRPTAPSSRSCRPRRGSSPRHRRPAAAGRGGATASPGPRRSRTATGAAARPREREGGATAAERPAAPRPGGWRRPTRTAGRVPAQQPGPQRWGDELVADQVGAEQPSVGAGQAFGGDDAGQQGDRGAVGQGLALAEQEEGVYSTGIEARSAHTAAARAASTAPRPRLTATSSGPATTVTPSPRLEIALAAHSRAKSAPSLGCRPRPVTDTTSRVGGWLVGRRPPGSPGTTRHASAGSLLAGSMAPAPGRRCSRPQAMPGPRSARPLRAVEPSPVQPDDVPASSGDGREGQLWASFRSEAGPSTVPRSTTVMSASLASGQQQSGTLSGARSADVPQAASGCG
jgi:hypothetical protein